MTRLCRETNLFDLLFKSLLQVFVAPNELVKDLKGKNCFTIHKNKWILKRELNTVVFTCAYACMVSMSSCALKRQNSVQVMSSDSVPPGAEIKHIFMS